jgi:hypothetical protein
MHPGALYEIGSTTTKLKKYKFTLSGALGCYMHLGALYVIGSTTIQHIF